MRIITSPAVRGSIIDERTGLPIAGAEVFVSKAEYDTPSNAVTGEIESGPDTEEQLIPPTQEELWSNARPPFVVSAGDGHFSIPAKKMWILYIVPMDIFFNDEWLVVRREGYDKMVKRVSSPYRELVDLGRITLRKRDEGRPAEEK